MKRLNKLFIIMLSSAALLMSSELMAAGPDSAKKKKQDTLELMPIDSLDSMNSGFLGKSNSIDPSDRHRHDHARCEVNKRFGVPCNDGFCDLRAGGAGGRGEHNDDSKLCKGHGGVASPS